jgi:DNA-binding MarR family transcriptional regulator
MTEPRWLDEREARLWQSYRDTHRELMRALEARMILRTRDLGRSVGWERSRLSHQVSRMERRGLVCREECTDDARGSMVRLTPLGRKAIDSAAPDHVAAVRTFFFDRLTPDEQTQLTTLLTRIANELPTTCTPADCDE